MGTSDLPDICAQAQGPQIKIAQTCRRLLVFSVGFDCEF